mmetsp:Transcript_14139/g.21128  ORF Transcript_14139/g.21128 Transcript_14139/m.21128 type:complete len:126 (-) Transcript_14139:106-483(-)
MTPRTALSYRPSISFCHLRRANHPFLQTNQDAGENDQNHVTRNGKRRQDQNQVIEMNHVAAIAVNKGEMGMMIAMSIAQIVIITKAENVKAEGRENERGKGDDCQKCSYFSKRLEAIVHQLSCLH